MIFDPYLPLGMYEGGNGKNRETFPHIPYNGNSSRKKMFADFANLRVFANIFLLNFRFLVLFIRAQRSRSSRSPPDLCKRSSANQMGAGSKFTKHNHTRAKHSTSVLEWMTRLSNCKSECVHYSYCIGAYCFVGLLQWQTSLEKWAWQVTV